jgi:hypothetical protein
VPELLRSVSGSTTRLTFSSLIIFAIPARVKEAGPGLARSFFGVFRQVITEQQIGWFWGGGYCLQIS